MNQTTDTILLVQPSHFRKNEDTAVNNYFQSDEKTGADVQELALAEFNNLQKILKENGVRTIIVPDEGKYDSPDSIFPNNVISFHENTAVLYPMFAPNRRNERKLNALHYIQKQGYNFEKVVDYSIYEEEELFLEGTGVLILDRENRLAYCSLSPRANEQLVHRFCEDFSYSPIMFEAFQTVEDTRLSIYHTNVMMALDKHWCVICLDSIDDIAQRNKVRDSLERTGKKIIEITEHQVNHFCGNILALRSSINQQTLIIMSTQAFDHFTEEQKAILSSFGSIVHAPLYTIEKHGGGSARCMIAEVFYHP